MRWLWVFVLHRPDEYVYSDMGTYVRGAERFLDGNYVQTVYDTLYPPGTAYFLGVLHHFDSSWQLAISVAFLMSSAVPLLCGLIAFQLFGIRVALVSVTLASLYWSFVDYAGYFLAEPLLIFCLALGMALLVLGLRVKRRWLAVGLGFGTGVVLGASATIKSVGLLAGCAEAAALALVATRHGSRRIWCVLLAATVGVALLVVPASVRCTRVQDGRFCLLGNEVGLNVLLGHRPGLRGIRLYDEKRETVMTFNCPTAMQKGYTGILQVEHGAYESGELSARAWEWIREHPVESVLLSIENVFDNFVGGVPWPSSETDYRGWALLSQQFYYLFVLFPAVFVLYSRRKEIIALSPAAVGLLLLIVPIFALFAASFIAKGEPRYRIPFDVFGIVLASLFYGAGGDRADPLDLAPPGGAFDPSSEDLG